MELRGGAPGGGGARRGVLERGLLELQEALLEGEGVGEAAESAV